MKSRFSFLSKHFGRAGTLALITSVLAIGIAVFAIMRQQRINSPENTLEMLRTVALLGYSQVNFLPEGTLNLSSPPFDKLPLAPGFESGKAIRAPWGGKLTVTKKTKNLVIDLYESPKNTCIELLAAAGSIPGVQRAAVNAAAVDERVVPIETEQIQKDCNNRVALLRFIVNTDAPVV